MCTRWPGRSWMRCSRRGAARAITAGLAPFMKLRAKSCDTARENFLAAPRNGRHCLASAATRQPQSQALHLEKRLPFWTETLSAYCGDY